MLELHINSESRRCEPWRVRTEDGNNTVSAGGTSIPLWLYGGDGNNTITGGNGGDTIGVGSGQNVIHDGNGWNSPEIVDDSDAGRAGIDNSFVSGNSWSRGMKRGHH